MNLTPYSRAQELQPCHRWHLPVGLLCPVDLQPSCRLTLAPSWEFFTTLDYEFNVIRGRRPYRWTIWVRNCSPFLRLPPTLSIGPNGNLVRFTPSLALPAFCT